jgi:hypothetical protein
LLYDRHLDFAAALDREEMVKTAPLKQAKIATILGTIKDKGT